MSVHLNFGSVYSGKVRLRSIKSDEYVASLRVSKFQEGRGSSGGERFLTREEAIRLRDALDEAIEEQ